MRSRSLRPVVQLAAFCAAMFFVRASFADHYKVPSGSMEPTVKTGDHVLVNKAAYGIRIPTTSDWVVRYGEPQRGDIVVLEADEPTTLLKRVVAVGGDTVEVKDGQVFIDGVMNDVRVECSYGGPDFGPAVVPDGEVLVLGDNRGNSRDGRTFGFVSRDRVYGRVMVVLPTH